VQGCCCSSSLLLLWFTSHSHSCVAAERLIYLEHLQDCVLHKLEPTSLTTELLYQWHHAACTDSAFSNLQLHIISSAHLRANSHAKHTNALAVLRAATAALMIASACTCLA
jgi:hypothetical protein